MRCGAVRRVGGMGGVLAVVSVWRICQQSPLPPLAMPSLRPALWPPMAVGMACRWHTCRFINHAFPSGAICSFAPSQTNLVATGDNKSVPPTSEWKLSPDAKYVHYCDNETIQGVEFKVGRGGGGLG